MDNFTEHLNKLLPSKAKEALTEFFFKKLESAKLNCYSDPVYSLADALKDIKADSGSYVGLIIFECFDSALKEYNREHPKCWDNEHQKAFRKK